MLRLRPSLGWIALVAAAVAAGPTSTGASGPPAGPPPPIRYRPVGCRVAGPAIAYRHGPRRQQVALTFDDGPWTDTPQLVATLERLRVPATFFLIGRQVAGHAALLRRELRDGDVLGNHTYDHPVMTRVRDAATELWHTSSAVDRAAGYRPCLWRPPYGAYDGAIVQTARTLGLTTIMWEVDPRDWATPGTPAIVSRVLAQVRPGSIVLMHDGGGPRRQTLAALPLIVHALRVRGLRIVTLLTLLGGHTVYQRCRGQCRGLGRPGPLPPGSVVKPGG